MNKTVTLTEAEARIVMQALDIATKALSPKDGLS